MKKFKLNIAWIAIFALIFTSCSKEETGVGLESGKATLSFGAVISDLVANREASKQSIGEIPECSDDAPAYVRIILLEGETEVVGTTEEPYRVNLAPGEIFTVEDPKLELEAGTYTLSHFSVYNEDDQLLWLAPRGGALANYVDVTLPINIDLRAGVKKYVDVSVLCYDNRDVNQYGYLFLEFNTIEAMEFCFFANFCDEAGKHFSARYSLDLWHGTDDSGVQIYDDLENTINVNAQGDFAASALCVAVPVNGDLNEDYLFYRLTLLDWEDNYGDVTQTTISGTLSRADIEANFGEGDAVEYEHFRFGCGDDDEEPAPTDTDGDGVPDSEDNCDTVDGPASNNGCPEVPVDTDGDGIPDSEDECDDVDGPASNNGCPLADTDGDGIPDETDNCDNEAGPASNGGCPEETPCDQTSPTADCDGDGTANECDNDSTNFATFDCDDDGVLNGVDACPKTPVIAGQVDPDGNGCWTNPDPSSCIDESATIVSFEGTVDVSGFPVGIDPFYPIEYNGEQVGTITFQLTVGTELVVLVDMFDGTAEDSWTSYMVTTAELTLPSINDSQCVQNIDANEFRITWDGEIQNLSYPLEVEFRANVIISME